MNTNRNGILAFYMGEKNLEATKGEAWEMSNGNYKFRSQLGEYLEVSWMELIFINTSPIQ